MSPDDPEVSWSRVRDAGICVLALAWLAGAAFGWCLAARSARGLPPDDGATYAHGPSSVEWMSAALIAVAASLGMIFCLRWVLRTSAWRVVVPAAGAMLALGALSGYGSRDLSGPIEDDGLAEGMFFFIELPVLLFLAFGIGTCVSAWLWTRSRQEVRVLG